LFVKKLGFHGNDTTLFVEDQFVFDEWLLGLGLKQECCVKQKQSSG
jgi:hypothetical protein